MNLLPYICAIILTGIETFSAIYAYGNGDYWGASGYTAAALFLLYYTYQEIPK